MLAGPPKIIQSVVPPAAREHVLGDLWEHCSSTRSDLADAVSAVPGAIARPHRRIADWQVLASARGGAMSRGAKARCVFTSQDGRGEIRGNSPETCAPLSGARPVFLISTLRIWFPPDGNRPRGEVL